MPVLGKTKQEVVSEFRSSEILEAARKVFARKGFNQATVDDIADAAQVAKGTLYLYFRSKRDIFMATLRQGILALHEDTRRRIEAAPTVEQKIRAFITTRLEYFDENQDFFRIYYSEFNNLFVHPVHVNGEFRDRYSRQAKMLQAVLDEAVRQGEIRVLRTDAAALTIYDMTRGMVAQRMLGWSKRDAGEDADFLFEMIWRGIACE